MIVKRVSDITRAEWLSHQWIEWTNIESPEREFARGQPLTPDESAAMLATLDRLREESGEPTA